ncbi:hypothetical protein DIS24_g7654 [Lasiodiplodia hormozganensis]|uniref:PNPLA domain-containing protein n=1 Tax=Lasiodiplodia hormozganensis TaxID=869390 RepID=A0AA40CQM3_9PEZI|nr:hypothetical protein DIS24_g7654 [Lasiodiplodia hormozganensis]
MEQIRDEDHLKDVPLPHQYFDLMGGTSTGGIIAIMLGRLRMPVDACIRAYTALAKEAFVPKHPYLPTLPGHPKGQFFATNLENAIKKVIKEQRGECSEHCKNKDGNSESCSHADMPFRDIDCTKTAVLAVTKVNVEAAPTLFKTYDTSTTFRDCTIWEVARATSAATSFFKSIKCGRDEIEFIDAAFGHNNPCEILIKEARRVFPDATKFQILSIGTGMGKVIDIKDSRKSILRALKEMTTSSKHVADRVADAYAVDEDYFRFNVDRGLEDVTLAEWDEKSTISGHTHNYLEKEGDRMLKCAQMLSKHRKNATVEKGSTPQAETDSKETAVSVQVDRVQTAFEK